MKMSLLMILPVWCAALTAGCAGGSTPPAAQTSGNAMLQWIDSSHDYGRIDEGQQLAVSFRFRNAGSRPLVIESVKPSCGCTVAHFPKEPVAAGAENEITAEFNSQHREGLQHKVLTVKANTPGGEQEVFFDVTVVSKATAATDR